MFTTAMGALNGTSYLNSAFDTGWLPAEEEDSTSATLKKLETWTKSDPLTVAITGDRTSRYKPGMKVKLDQDSVTKYFKILTVSYLNPYTNLTLDGYGVYTLSDSAITNCYYSILINPVGWPFVLANAITSAPSGNITATNIQDAINQLDALRVNKNYLINGSFDIWQRGTSFASTGYTADRWYLYYAGSSATVSQQAFTLGQTAVPGEPAYFLRVSVTSVSGAANVALLEQYIESVKTLAGQTATLSFWAKADGNKPIVVEFAQVFGTGGTPSSTVIGIGVTKLNLTTSWQRYTITVNLPSIAGKTLGTNNNDYLRMRFWFDAGSNYDSQTNSLGQQSGVFDIWGVQLEKGSVATDFEYRPIQQELALCQRFYEKGYFRMRAAAGPIGSMVFFKTSKRIAPTVTYTVGGLGGTIFGINCIDKNVFFVEWSALGTDNNVDINWIADAEL